MKITFFGAVEEVTGSRYLVTHNNQTILVDCGMFQGTREITQRNYNPFPVDPRSINAIILTHAHIDHTGYIPALVKNGFSGPIYCSKGTYALCSLLLIDSGAIQEYNAQKRDQRGGPNHPPSVLLYTKHDAEVALRYFKPIEYDAPLTIGSLTVKLVRSGHILGSSFVIISDGSQTLTFSGDLGRPQQLILKSPPPLTQTDYLVLESTYGDRMHKDEDTLKVISDVVHATVAKNGMLIIPSFAVERTETILYCLYQLREKKAIPDIPIFLNSPLAIRVAELLCDFKEEYKFSSALCRDMRSIATYTPTPEESMQLEYINPPAIIIAGSGMADGGRVLFHFQQFISDPKNTILFVGYQAKGTLGHTLVHGADNITINNKRYPVKADIKALDTLSAHADYEEILEWLSHFTHAPKRVFLTHGEIKAATALQHKIEERFGWNVIMPTYAESFELE